MNSVIPAVKFPQPPVSLTVEQAFHQAICHHQAGQLQDAERLYRAILQAQPDHADANHNLGVLTVKLGQHATGLPFLKNALALNPLQEQYLLSYAGTLFATGHAREAVSAIQAGMARGLNTPATQLLLQKVEPAALLLAEYNQLVSLFNLKQYVEACERARILAERYPESELAWKALAAPLQALGKPALPALQRVVELAPSDPEAYSNLAVANRNIGQLDNAVACCRRALRIKPDHAEAGFFLANLLLLLGELEEGWRWYESRHHPSMSTKYLPIPSGLTAPQWQGQGLVGKDLLVFAGARHRRPNSVLSLSSNTQDAWGTPHYVGLP